MPKPSTVRNTPLLRLLLDQPLSSPLAGDADVEVAVGGEDHAVDAALDEVLLGDRRRPARCRRRRWSSRRPGAGRARRGSSAARRPAWTASTRPRARRRRRSPRGRSRRSCSASIRMPCFSSGSLLGELIEPETSSRNTRLRGGPLVARHFLALQPDAHQPVLRRPRGRSATSMCAANGPSSSAGGGSRSRSS